jgi:hypothetical protein
MDGMAKIQTNIMTQNFSYGINGHYVNSSINGNNKLSLGAVLKIKFSFNLSVSVAMSLLLKLRTSRSFMKFM